MKLGIPGNLPYLQIALFAKRALAFENLKNGVLLFHSLVLLFCLISRSRSAQKGSRSATWLCGLYLLAYSGFLIFLVPRPLLA